MLAANAPWWAGERGNLPHAADDNRPANEPQTTGTNGRPSNPSQYPSQQSAQPQAAPSRAPDMSAYAQTSSTPNTQSQSPYARYGVPPIQGPSGGWTPPQGARQNDLSGQVPSNQIWGQAYNQASDQFGGNTQAQSWTMPGSFASQGYNPTTGQYGQPTSGPSWDGNMAYNAIDQRPGPIQASATGVGGNPMQWQDAMTQREAFVGNLSDRLNQYSGGQLTGQPTFDPSRLLNQANDQLSNGTFYNPFGQQNPDVQRAMGGASQYATGSQWQNPFGNSPQANNPMPSFGVGGQPPIINTSSPNQTAAQPTGSPPQSESPRISPGPFNPYGHYDAPPLPAPSYVTPGAAQPKPDPSQGTRYDPSSPQPSLPPVNPIQSQLDSQKRAAEYRAKNNITLPRSEPTQEDLYRQHPNLRPKQDYTNMIPGVDYSLETGRAVNPNKTQADYRADRSREQERTAMMDLRDTGRGTSENVAGVRQYFNNLNRATQNPSQYPPGGRTAPGPQARGEASPPPAAKRGQYTRTPMPWRASR